MNKARLLEKIGELVKDKRIDGISAIRDESNRNGMRIVIELKKRCKPSGSRSTDFTSIHSCRTSYSMIMIALVDGQPRLLEPLRYHQ